MARITWFRNPKEKTIPEGKQSDRGNPGEETEFY